MLAWRAYKPDKPGEPVIRLKGGEQIKQWNTLESLLAQFVTHGLDRTACVAAVGGGALLDVVAFATAIYLRGIAFIGVPSTLLSMVDASLGGKNAINFLGYKNLLGTIVQPKRLLFDLRLLDSLAEEDWRDGFAEVIKYACIADVELFDALKKASLEDYRGDRSSLKELVLRCLHHKEKIITGDFEDRGGARIVLNFGHSLGHALEGCLGCSHGQAVACGMVFAAWLSVQEKALSESEFERICALIVHYGLPIYMEAEVEALISALERDKKCLDDGLQMVFLQKIGSTRLKRVPFAYLEAQLRRFEREHP